MTKKKAGKPSLLERESTGGDIGDAGFEFQLQIWLAHVPKWMAMEGFTSTLREGIGDIEARFFVPGRGFKKEFLEVKSSIVAPAEFWGEVDRFRTVDAGSKGEYQWFTLAAPGLSEGIHPLMYGLRRLRQPYGFYDAGSTITENTYEDYVGRVENEGKSREIADFLYQKVLILDDLGGHRQYGRSIFKEELRNHIPMFRDLNESVLDQIYSDLATFLHGRRATTIKRVELEHILNGKLPSGSRPIKEPVRIDVMTSDTTSSTSTALQLKWERFFGGKERVFPPPQEWNEQLGELQHVREWISEHRDVRRIAVGGHGRLSTMITLGAVFSAVAGYVIEFLHRDTSWVSDAHPDATTPPYSFADCGSHKDKTGEHLNVSIGILREIKDDVAGDLRCFGLDSMPTMHLYGAAPIVSPQQANLIVQDIKKRIALALRETTAQQIDLFFAGPAPLALFLGHRLNATASIQCYEHDGTGSYVKTVFLPFGGTI